MELKKSPDNYTPKIYTIHCHDYMTLWLVSGKVGFVYDKKTDVAEAKVYGKIVGRWYHPTIRLCMDVLYTLETEYKDKIIL